MQHSLGGLAVVGPLVLVAGAVRAPVRSAAMPAATTNTIPAGELLQLGYRVAPSTVWLLLKRAASILRRDARS